MKKQTAFLFILAFTLLITNAHGQKPSITLTFNAQYQGGYVLLQSIHVENLTQGGDTTIYAPNNTLELNYSLGIGDMEGEVKNALTISQNRPNPFFEQTSINIFMPEADHLQLIVTNLLGQKVAFYENSLAAGIHSFVFNPGAGRYYVLTAAANGMVRAIKMVGMNKTSQKTGSLVYQGSKEIQVENKSTKEVNGFGYSLGDQLRFTGIAKFSSDILGSDVILDNPGADKTYLFVITNGIPCPGMPTVTDFDDNIYNTVQIGDQCWMKDNLNIGTMINVASNQTNNSQIEKYCWNNDPANCATYGGLYQWDEVMQYTTQQGTKGICPDGWHIPDDNEWCTLTQFIDPIVDCNEPQWSGIDVGTKMKSTAAWDPFNATNTSGFTALPGGGFYDYFGELESGAYFWSSSVYDADKAWTRHLYITIDNVGRSKSVRNSGFSIRCLRNESTTDTPEVETGSVLNITPITADVEGEITKLGGSEITQHGHCWSTEPGPSIDDFKTEYGPATYTGLYISNLTGLNPETIYYVKAYAINSYGLDYGDEISFQTLVVGVGDPCPGMPTVTDFDDNVYNTVQIGDQCWMKESLKTTTYNNGTTIPNVTDASTWLNLTSGAYVWYDNDISWKDSYGALYNWYAATDTNALCPTGWHVPTINEWTVLTDFIGGTGEPHGNELKSCRQMYSPLGGDCSTTEHPRWNEDAQNWGTDDYGFSGLPGGVRGEDDFEGSGYLSAFWLSTMYSLSQAHARLLEYNEGFVSEPPVNMEYGISVRCLRNESTPDTPEVETGSVLNITPSSADVAGEITNLGGSDITQHGHCWSTEPGPSIDDFKTELGPATATGTFTSNLISLDSATTYYVKAYAINSFGLSYGETISFLTIDAGVGEPCPGMPTVTDFDDNVYNTVQIGDQCWMKENLKTTTYNNGTTIPNVTDASAWLDLTSGAYVWYDNDISWKDSYGALYNWYAATDANALCPTGWHVPTNNEWTVLTDFIGGTGEPHGNELKSCRQMYSPLGGDCSTTEHPRWYPDEQNWGTDGYGFSALPGGSRSSYEGNFGGVGGRGSWWSSVEFSSNFAWLWELNYEEGDVSVPGSDIHSGYSIRCLRDENPSDTPEVETGSALIISPITADVAGEITKLGGSEITQHGHCWSTEPGPSIDDFKTELGPATTTCSYISNLTGLIPETIYYVKAYAINSFGLSYGEPNSFVISGQSCPSTSTDIDENEYNTVRIGDQCWMKENLRTTTYNNGLPIPNVTDSSDWSNLTTGAYVWYDNDISWKDPYGALYNWLAVDDPNRLCPTGWHVPNNDEWTVLTDFIGGTGTPHGNELKSCRQVNSPLGGGCNTSEHPRWNEDDNNRGTDEYGFSALPGGGSNSQGNFNYLGQHGNWWSATQPETTSSELFSLYYSSGEVWHGFSIMGGRNGYSIRCLRDEFTSITPEVETGSVLNIIHTTADVEGEITNTGSYGTELTQHGHCWSTEPDPTIDDFKTELGPATSTGSYISNLTGLNPETIYYVKAYVINNFGIGYGDEISFQTLVAGFGDPCPGMPTVTDFDGNDYNTVQIGYQCWMKENLKTTTYNNGTAIPKVTDASAWLDLTSGAYVWYDNDISWKDPYGALYNWYAVDDPNGLCPTGWHVPTHDEWTVLTDFIGGVDQPHGNELKSCRQVNSPLGGSCNTTEHPRWDEDTINGSYGTDNYGFSGLPGGKRNNAGFFGLHGHSGYWWSSTEFSWNHAWSYNLQYYHGYVGEEWSRIWIEGHSVRCIKD